MKAFRYTISLDKETTKTPIESLRLSNRAHNALRRNHIFTVGDLVDVYYELRTMKNIGRSTTSEIKRELFCWYIQSTENRPGFDRLVDSMEVAVAEHAEALK